ncbi:MAG: glycosyltransferase family 1 protein [Desulfobacteraceae bacterium]|nr:MAG: glycosyltransferase family 1 protein [Desulfobacteraceae bacterium]
MKMRKLRIGIDGRSLSKPLTGIGRYAYELCRELGKIVKNAEFFLYSHLPIEPENLPHAHWIQRVDSNPMSKHMSSYVWLKLRCGSLCRKDELDIFWATATLLPKLSKHVASVVTVHDLNYLIVPETMPPLNLWSHRIWFKNDVKKADIILANSKATSNRLYTAIRRRASAVVYPGVADFFEPKGKEEISRCLKKYNIQGPYLLAVGTQEPRKNLELLLLSFSDLKKRKALNNYKLAIVGSSGWKTRKTRKLLSVQNNEDIHQLGYVPECDLPALYSGSDLFIFPSIYEGFGMPVSEARACGARIVTTDIPELREAGGADAYYIRPTLNGIKEGIIEALSSKWEKSESAFENRYSWRASAEILANNLLLAHEFKKQKYPAG